MSDSSTKAQSDQGSGGNGAGDGSGSTSEAQERARLVAGIVGVVLVAAFVVACIVADRSRGNAPAYVHVDSVEHASHGSTETFTATVENTGDITAEQVLVRGTVGDADPVDHEIDFLAPGETDEVTFTGPAGTKRSDVHVRVHAWTSSE